MTHVKLNSLIFTIDSVPDGRSSVPCQLPGLQAAHYFPASVESIPTFSSFIRFIRYPSLTVKLP